VDETAPRGCVADLHLGTGTRENDAGCLWLGIIGSTFYIYIVVPLHIFNTGPTPI
jgi:hypothetical protein